jgi:ATP-binding cassette subfamily F protein uup
MPGMEPPLLHLRDIALRLGTAPLLDGAELAVGRGDRLCLVGRNGSGKSTLLRIAAGALRPDSGERFVQPGASLRYLPQEPDLSGHASALAYAEEGLDPAHAHRARLLLQQLGVAPEAEPAHLSGGESRRCALARALAPQPDLLLLDEPTNHLDLPAIEWLEAELSRLRAGIVLVSHDRRLLQRIGRATIWLEGGRTRQLDAPFDRFETWRDETLEQEERDRHKLVRQVAREEDWLRYGVTARRKRNVRRLADLHSLRDQRREQAHTAPTLRLDAAGAESSGKLVAVAEEVSKSYAGRRIVHRLSLRVLRGDRLGIVGANGAGKTTLLRLLTGTLQPDEGEVRLGASLAAVTLDQQRASLDPARTLADTLTGSGGTGGAGDQVQVGDGRRHVVGYMKDFLFRPEQARTPVGQLSGGERGRLALACALARPSNLLVLDEPTNDLDLETLDLLQEMLNDYAGTVLLVSHDRDFLDRVATSTLAAEGGGRWTEYAGGYSDMLAQGGMVSGAAAAVDHAPSRAAVKPQPPRPESRQSSRQSSRRLSGRDQHALRLLPAQIEAFEADVARLRQRLSDQDFYHRDPAGFAQASEALALAEAGLASAEQRWLELEMLREEIEA